MLKISLIRLAGDVRITGLALHQNLYSEWLHQ